MQVPLFPSFITVLIDVAAHARQNVIEGLLLVRLISFLPLDSRRAI